MSPRRKLSALVVFVLGVLLALEVLARSVPLDAVAHRVLFKLALLERSQRSDVLVLGSSRANDCIDPSVFSPRGFNLATPSSSLQTLEFIAARAPTGKLAFIELSAPQMHDAPLEFFTPAASTVSDPFGDWLWSHSWLLQRRRALSFDNWLRIPALLFPSGYDGTEFFRTRWLSESFVTATEPAHLLTGTAGGPGPMDSANVLAGYQRVVHGFRERNVKVVLFSTPLEGAPRAEECSDVARARRASIAHLLDVPYVDFSCVDAPADTLTDRREHCGTQGRRLVSLSLAHALH